MSEKIIRIIKTVVFVGIFCLLFVKITQIIQQKWPERTATEIRFHSEPVNSIDALFIGSSSFYRGISPLVLWNEYGISSYVQANSNQSPLGLYDSVEDALKTQNLKLVVIDGVVLLREFKYIDYEVHIRKYVDPIPFSERKLKLIYEFWQKENKLSIIGFFFPVIQYHSRWNELTEMDYLPFNKDDVLDTKGQTNSYIYTPVSLPKDYMKYNQGQHSISDDARTYYDRIVKLCNEKSIKMVFVTLPRMNWTYQSHAAVQHYADLYQIPYIDFSFPEEIQKTGLDLNYDFRDLNHLNFLGSQKMSIAVGKRLLEIYPLQDHRKDNAYSAWDDLYRRYTKEALDPKKMELVTNAE